MQRKPRFVQLAVLAVAVLVLVGFVLYRAQRAAEAAPQATATSPAPVHMGGSKSMVLMEPADLPAPKAAAPKPASPAAAPPGAP